jgi:hypothetical protein
LIKNTKTIRRGWGWGMRKDFRDLGVKIYVEIKSGIKASDKIKLWNQGLRK